MTEHAAIIRNRLCIVTPGASVIGLGIRGFRAGVKQIESSDLELKPSTQERLAVLKDGIRIWENRAK